MRYSFLLLLSCLLFAVSCANYKKEDLHGSWKNSEISFTFNADNTFKMDMGLNKLNGTYRNAVGNSVEMINEEGKVVFEMRIKSLQGDNLTINIPSLGTDRIYELKRVAASSDKK